MKARLVWLILCCIWGSTWLFIKIGLEDLPPLTFAGIRFVIASAILIVILFVRRLPFAELLTNWRLLAYTGVLSFTFNYGFIFWGEQHISSGLAALLQATIPAFGFGPLSEVSFIAEIDYKLYCRPCGLHGYKKCPEGHFKCSEIDVDHIVEKSFVERMRT